MAKPFVPPQVVLLTDDDGDEIAAYLTRAMPRLDLRVRRLGDLDQEELDQADACIGFRSRTDLDWRGLRWVHCSGAGHDAFTESVALAPEVIVSRTIGGMPTRIAEYVAARLLAFTQRLPELFRLQQAVVWERRKPRKLAGTRALILGVGPMGQAAAKTLTGLGVTCTGVGTRARQLDGFEEVVSSALLHEDDLSDVDWLVSVLPINEETRGFLGHRIFQKLRGAGVVNIGRGATLDESALIEALEAGHVAAAALDVFEREPLPSHSPLWRHPRVLVSPHVAAPTLPSEVSAAFVTVCRELEAGTLAPLVVR